MLIQIALASPEITNVIYESNVWIEENNDLSLICTDDSFSVSNVTVMITGPNVTLPLLTFNNNGNSIFSLDVDGSYLDRTGNFNAILFCTNINDESVNTSVNFLVSNLEGNITHINPTTIYSDDIIEIFFSLISNGNPVTSDVVFNLTLNDVKTSLKLAPAYDSNDGWILKLNPIVNNVYDLEVFAFYDGNNISSSKTIDVEDTVGIRIVSVNIIDLKENDNITIVLDSKNKNTIIELTESNLDIHIQENLDIERIEKIDNLFHINVIAPSLNYGNHEIVVTLNYNGEEYEDTKRVVYKLPIEGSIINDDGNSIQTTFRFIDDDEIILEFSTDSSGSYSNGILPDTYDLKLVFPQAELLIEDAKIFSFNDPIKYEYFDSLDIPGMITSGVFAFDASLNYSRISIKTSYDPSIIKEEELVQVLKCSLWNFGSNFCDGNWIIIDSDIDTFRNIIEFESNNLSTFTIGVTKSINIVRNLDKDFYKLRDLARLQVVTRDGDRNIIENVNVNVYSDDFPINITKNSDFNGVALFDFVTPNEEGNFTIILSATKLPFINYTEKIIIETLRNRDVSIISNSELKIIQGEKITEEIKIVNIGQDYLSEINISVIGMPDYFVITPNLFDLEVDERKTIELHVLVPVNSSPGIFNGKIQISSEGFVKEKDFSLSISKINQTIVVPSTTGFAISLPEISLSENYILIFAILAFGVAFILKKMKRKSNSKFETLNDVKSNLDEFTSKHMSLLSKNNDLSELKEKIGSKNKFESAKIVPVENQMDQLEYYHESNLHRNKTNFSVDKNGKNN